MLSPRCLTIFALIATAVALPASEKPIPEPITTITNDEIVPIIPAPWFSVPYFGDITKIFAPLWKLFPSFEELGPKIYADEKRFQVIVQVKEYSKEDLKVKVKGDFIFVQGTHEAKEAGHDLFASQFFHTYTLPANSSAADVTAELTNDGYLIVNAPITGISDKSKEADREVPIVDTGAPFKKEETIAASEAPETPEIPEPTAVPETPKTPEILEPSAASEAPKTPEILEPSTVPEAPKTTEILEPSTALETPKTSENPETLEKQPESPEVLPLTTSEPEIVSEEDRKEPTTPQTDREEVTVNDNVIPHGNEANEVIP